MDALRVERDGPVLRVTLARPERRNAFDAALIAELTEAFAAAGDARAVVLAGDGPSFSAGGGALRRSAAGGPPFHDNPPGARGGGGGGGGGDRGGPPPPPGRGGAGP